MKKLRIGILGCGAVAHRWYLKGLNKKNSAYETVVVCDIRKEAAIKAAALYAIPNFCTQIEEMTSHSLDLVVILTRHKDHYQHITYFLKNGVNVYSEKPFAATLSEAKKIIDLAAKKNLTVGSAPQVMLSTRNQTVKKLIVSGKIGKVSLVRASSSNLGPAGRADTDYDPVWFYNEGGSLASLGIYGLSALIYFLGLPKVVSCYQGIAMGERTVMYGPAKGKKFRVTVPDNVVALLDFGQGTFALFDGSYSVATPAKYEFEIHGTKGSLLVGGFGGTESIVFVDLAKNKTNVGPNDDCHLRWNLSLGVEETVKAIQNKKEPQTSVRFAYSVLKVIVAMKKSAANKIHIAVKTDKYVN